MRIYVDLVTLLPTAEVWERGQIVSTTAKRGDGDPLEVQFHRSGVPERLPLGTVVTFIIKSQGKFDESPALVELEMTDANRPAADSGYYTGEPDYNTEPLDDGFFSGDANTANDLRTVLGDGEISWLYPTPGAKPKSSQTFLVTVANDVKKGNEGAASSGAPTYLTAAQSDARYLHMQLATATVDIGADTVDIDITAWELAAAPTTVLPGGIQLPNNTADRIGILAAFPVNATTLRAYLTAAPSEAGYKAHVLFR